MRDFPPLLILAVALILALAWRQYQHQRNQEARNDAAPLRTIMAEIKAKREFPQTRNRSRGYEDGFKNMFYEATFRPVNGGADITLRLSQTDYNQLDKDMRGMLQLKGTRFISFAPRQE
ncbi:DUF2500 domain-containing protein [Brenneria izadpanahii]|uniref:DUF2500 domain-containing protein n=1 Tax=Brenneria izadpanahii TaxID=2722756 RepID=A0ABX7V0K6_9GAMM|nr:DUF2500 domain-containing protein [Brenneria izadpanahii]QTF10412.1 DUF2500 domain-containing protein [Brenneria izadpanahii]